MNSEKRLLRNYFRKTFPKEMEVRLGPIHKTTGVFKENTIQEVFDTLGMLIKGFLANPNTPENVTINFLVQSIALNFVTSAEHAQEIATLVRERRPGQDKFFQPKEVLKMLKRKLKSKDYHVNALRLIYQMSHPEKATSSDWLDVENFAVEIYTDFMKIMESFFIVEDFRQWSQGLKAKEKPQTSDTDSSPSTSSANPPPNLASLLATI